MSIILLTSTDTGLKDGAVGMVALMRNGGLKFAKPALIERNQYGFGSTLLH
jgi:hypothetical protein